MTLEEAIRLANNGDTNTMVVLANYYAGNQDYEDSLVWSRKAAQAGDLNGMYLTFLTDTLMLSTSVIISPDEDDDAYFREIEQYADFLKSHSNFDLEPSYSDSKYSYAESLYRREKYSPLLSLVQNEQQGRFRVMYALALFAASSSLSDDQKAEYYEHAAQVIQSVLDSGYVPAKAHHEQVQFIHALGTYSSILRIGLTSKPNVSAAYQILAAQRNNLTEEDAISFLSDLLSHYRVKKGFFGTTITYVD